MCMLYKQNGEPGVWTDIVIFCYLQLGWQPVAEVQYTFTHNNTEQLSETEYTEHNIHNSRNT
jgi:hypothetical protein